VVTPERVQAAVDYSISWARRASALASWRLRAWPKADWCAPASQRRSLGTI